MLVHQIPEDRASGGSAARRVLTGCGVPITVVPPDLTHRTRVDSTWLDRLGGSGRIGSTLAAMSRPCRAHYRELLGTDVLVLHDAVALAEVIWPDILERRPMTVDAECGFGPARGALVADSRAHSPARGTRCWSRPMSRSTTCTSGCWTG
ncbi:nucleoside hydrolase [Kibdelosporangium phytohabitans]|uniref:nucleoside hydrolase n=1 Tax=Kibdelosporangium phytohabitans TaxID=860235 RepID=UPI00146FF34E